MKGAWTDRVGTGRVVHPSSGHTSHVSRPVGYRRHLTSSPFAPPAEPPPVEVYAAGERVLHDRYGLGRVLRVEGGSAVIVDFGDRHVRITAPFKRLAKL